MSGRVGQWKPIIAHLTDMAKLVYFGHLIITPVTPTKKMKTMGDNISPGVDGIKQNKIKET